MKTQYSLLVIAIAVVITLSYIAVLTVYPYKILEVHSAVVTNASSTEIVYKVDYCRYDYPLVSVTRTIHSLDETQTYLIPGPLSSAVTLGCHKVNVHSPLFPIVLQKGVYYILIASQTKVNNFRTMDYTFKTNIFEIK